MLIQAQPKGKLHRVLDNAWHYRSRPVGEFVQVNPQARTDVPASLLAQPEGDRATVEAAQGQGDGQPAPP